MSAQTAALELSQEILKNIELQELPLSAVLLRSRRLARLVNDHGAYEWFGYELNGYPLGDNGLIEAAPFQVALAHGRDAGKNDRGPLADVRTVATLEAMAAASELRLQQEREPDIHHVPANQWDILPKGNGQLVRAGLVDTIASVKGVLARVQGHVHRWVEAVAYELEFSQTVDDIWERRRKLIDAKLAELAPEAFRRLTSLYSRVAEDDPEAWSQAAQTVRNVLKAMADALKPATTAGVAEGPEGKDIQTTDDKYKNRLLVFVHEREKDSKGAALITGKIEGIYRSIADVYGAASDVAKRTTSRIRIEDLVLNLYLLLGSLVLLAGKDLVPQQSATSASSNAAIPASSINPTSS